MGPRSYDRWRLAVALVGLAIAGYLTLLHYDTRVPLVCGDGTGAVVDCEAVLTSPSSVFLGIPVAVLGVVWFAVVVVLAALTRRASHASRRRRLHAAALGWTLVGTGCVLWLVYQELGVIGRICAWCTGVHVLVLALFVLQVRAMQVDGAAGGTP